MKTIYTLAIALMAGVILTACGITPITINSVNPDDSLIKRCIMDDNANAPSCASIVADNPCITDPFDVACDITFADYYKTAQENRISFCRENDNPDFCASAIASGRVNVASEPTSICAVGLLPFDDVCSDARFNANKIEHCNQSGLSTRDFQTGQPHADLERCTELATENPCLANPFQEICETTAIFENDIDRFRFGRISLCSFGGGSSAPCAFVNSCGDNGNPFGAECLKFDAFNSNRATRVALCTEGQGNVIAGCINSNRVGTQTINQCIFTNPFHADCTHDAFDAARVARVAECSEASPNAALNCSSVIGVNIGSVDGTQTIANCITEPFHADCQNLAFNTVRANRMIACGEASDPSGVSCTLARAGATSANWLRSFDNSNNNPRLDTEPDTTNPRNQFLQGTEVVPVILDDDGEPENPTGREGGLDVGAVRTTINERPTVVSLNLRDARYGEIEEGSRIKPFLLTDAEGEPTGDASDGVAFFSGTIGGNTLYYAGILAGTNLGAPPTETRGTAEWNGQFRVIGTYFVNKDFTLNITFSNRNVGAFVQVNDNQLRHFLINGTFDANTGVIDGTVQLGDFANNQRTATPTGTTGSGLLTGLIGQDGAVGAFHSTATGTNGYAGGFVARPPSE